MSLTHAKVKQLTTELQEIQKSEEHDSSHRCLGRELRRLTETGQIVEGWHKTAERNLSFVKECVALRCNEATYTIVNFTPDDDYKFLIGDCLSRNTHVVDLTVVISALLHIDDARKSVESLIRYVRTSSDLRRICVTGYGTSRWDTTIIALLNAIGHNPNIKEMDWQTYAPPKQLHQLLVQSPPTSCDIQTLSIALEAVETYPDQPRLLLPRAIANCVSLVKLRLKSMSSDWRMIESTLYHLARVPTPLQELSLYGSAHGGNSHMNAAQLQALTHFLKVTTTLQHLELLQFKFTNDTVGPILEGMRHHYARPTASISKLSMIQSQLDAPASNKFAHFMQVTRYNNSCSGTVLKELNLMFDGQVQVPSAIASSLVCESLMHSCQSSHIHLNRSKMCNHSLGSGLKVLNLQPVQCMVKFLEALQSNAKYINLPCLHLSDIGHEECVQLASCLPNLLSLQELYLDKVDDTMNCSVLLLSMIQRCGNLCMVSIQNDVGCALLSASQTNTANAFCTRNQILFLLLSKPKQNDSSFHMNRKQANGPTHCMTLTMQDYDTVLLLPMLLHAAKQVPLTKVSAITTALMNLVVEGIESI